MCLQTLTHAINEKRGHRFEREQGGTWEGSEGGKGCGNGVNIL